MDVFLPGQALLKLEGGVLVLLVLDQLPDQLPARIVLVGLVFRRTLVVRQNDAALDVDQRGGDHEVLAGHFEIEHLDQAQVVEVLAGDPLDGNVVDVEFVLLDEVKQKVERPLEDGQLDVGRIFRVQLGEEISSALMALGIKPTIQVLSS